MGYFIINILSVSYKIDLNNTRLFITQEDADIPL